MGAERGRNARIYAAKTNGRFANDKHRSVHDLFSRHGQDLNDYTSDMTSNPTHRQVQSHPGTKLLKRHGYHGIVHYDYDPHDQSKDTRSVLVFNAKKHTKDFRPHNSESSKK